MNTGLLLVHVAAGLTLSMTNPLRAEQIIEFSGTIVTSPFVTPGFAAGNALTGWYTYDPAATALESGANYALYPMGGTHLMLGGLGYDAIGGGRLNVVHFLPEITPNAVDFYDLFGFTLRGPAVEGFFPAFSELKLTDTDNSVYANQHPPVIDLPDPQVFELWDLRIGFLGSPPSVSREILARIDSIKKIQENVDMEPPEIVSITATPSVLWPPNGKMVPVQIVVVAEDNVGVASCKIISVTSTESAESFRGGNKAGPTWLITGDLTLALRAERTGPGGGRVYDIAVECSDEAGNTSIGHTQVSVPRHAEGKRNGAQ